MERYNFTNHLLLLKIEFLMRRFLILVCIVFFTACDDGDILTVELDFDGALERCVNDNLSYLIYDTRDDPSESLLLIIDRNETNDLLFEIPTPVGEPTILNISSEARFIYRTYNRSIGSGELCDVIPPADLIITEDYEASTGTVEITVTIVDDDGDGIPNEKEYGPGGLSDPQDSDGDGIFDYLDEDDDNDNVKTRNEIDTANADGDNDPTTNPLDTDGDGIPDYLDTDDDGDGVLTIEEDEDGDRNPLDDLGNNADGELVPHYLNTLETINYGSSGIVDLSENVYTRTVTTRFLVKNIDLEILRTTEIDFGILTTTLRDYTPD
jgi:hypothetical protein